LKSVGIAAGKVVCCMFVVGVIGVVVDLVVKGV
jgi:hypothetical protein